MQLFWKKSLAADLQTASENHQKTDLFWAWKTQTQLWIQEPINSKT